jgi:acetyl/propionyl-CoA carboxylase alpha subunit
MKYEIVINGARRTAEFSPPPRDAASHTTFAVDGRVFDADVARIFRGEYSILIGGRSLDVTVGESAAGLLIRAKGREFRVEIFDPRSWRRGRGAGMELEGRQRLVAPMPGKIVRVMAAAGQQVSAGQGLLVIEAMKMQNEIRSPKSGTIEKLAGEGQTVNAGEVLAIVA